MRRSAGTIEVCLLGLLSRKCLWRCLGFSSMPLEGWMFSLGQLAVVRTRVCDVIAGKEHQLGQSEGDLRDLARVLNQSVEFSALGWKRALQRELGTRSDLFIQEWYWSFTRQLRLAGELCAVTGTSSGLSMEAHQSVLRAFSKSLGDLSPADLSSLLELVWVCPEGYYIPDESERDEIVPVLRELGAEQLWAGVSAVRALLYISKASNVGTKQRCVEMFNFGVDLLAATSRLSSEDRPAFVCLRATVNADGVVLASWHARSAMETVDWGGVSYVDGYVNALSSVDGVDCLVNFCGAISEYQSAVNSGDSRSAPSIAGAFSVVGMVVRLVSSRLSADDGARLRLDSSIKTIESMLQVSGEDDPVMELGRARDDRDYGADFFAGFERAIGEISRIIRGHLSSEERAILDPGVKASEIGFLEGMAERWADALNALLGGDLSSSEADQPVERPRRWPPSALLACSRG